MTLTSPSEQGSGLDQVADAFRGAMVDSFGSRPKLPNTIVELLADHFGVARPDELPAVTDSYPTYLQVSFQLALDEFLDEPGRTHRILGVEAPSARGGPLDGGATSLALLLADPSMAWAPVVFAPAVYDLRPAGCDEVRACLRQGLILFRDDQGPGAIWVRGMIQNRLMIDVLHASAQRSTNLLADLRERGVELSPYRGQVVTVTKDGMYAPMIEFIQRPTHTEAEQVILPPGLLEEIEEHSTEVLRARSALVASGRHFKRGLLLHGRPGTGKTHTIRYLVSAMPDVTAVLMPAQGMKDNLAVIQDVIPMIEPAVIVLDDVDFIAEDRSLPGLSGSRDDLFALLELLDGINDDADLLFVLTTNRPNTLEPAIAARPGRIDQAIEVPLPDADCRRRLLDLYSRDMSVDARDDELSDIVERTDGVTASFIREIVRRAAVLSVVEEGADVQTPIKVDGVGLRRALDELLDPSNPLTPLLLGAEPQHAAPLLALVTGPAGGSRGEDDGEPGENESAS